MGELVKVEQAVALNESDIDVLVKASIIPKETPKAMIEVFARNCHERNLSPFSKQIYLVARAGKYTIQTGIDGFRSLAERTSKYGGSEDYLFNDGKTMFQMIQEKQDKPITATATVFKIIQGVIVKVSATAVWTAYFPGDALGFMWKKMPFLMLAKCAESLALRKAFPEVLGGLYTDEETQQADEVQGKEILTPSEATQSKNKDIQVEEAIIIIDNHEAEIEFRNELGIMEKSAILALTTNKDDWKFLCSTYEGRIAESKIKKIIREVYNSK